MCFFFRLCFRFYQGLMALISISMRVGGIDLTKVFTHPKCIHLNAWSLIQE